MAPPAEALQRADELLRSSVDQADRTIRSRHALIGFAQDLERADRELKRRLQRVVAPLGEVTFGEAQLVAYSRQIEVVLQHVRAQLFGLTRSRALATIDHSVRHSSWVLARLNSTFTGVAVPLRIREAAVLGELVDNVQSSLLTQFATSVDRYGHSMIVEFRRIMRDGLLQGASTHQVVDALVGHGGPRGPRVSTRATVDPATGKVVRLREEDIPEGLFRRKRYWAERIVRTEVAHAQNAAALATVDRARATDFPDMGKKILATFDNRTALDSVAVHGQVRAPTEMFIDGAGRQYLRPPARPNDRETVVPWRLRWPETPYSSPVPPQEVARVQAEAEPGVGRREAVRRATERARARLEPDQQAAMRRIRKLVEEKRETLARLRAEATR